MTPPANLEAADTDLQTIAVGDEAQPAGSRAPCKLYLNADVLKRLALTVAMQGKTRSDIVEALLAKHLPRYDIREIIVQVEEQRPSSESASAA